MQFTWDTNSIQADVIYFKFSFNNKNWLLTSVNNDMCLIDITKSWHKSYFLTLNKINNEFNTSIHLNETETLNVNVDFINRTINMEIVNE